MGKIWERGYDSVGTRGREALLQEMSFQPVVEDNSDVLTGGGLEVSQTALLAFAALSVLTRAF